MSNPTTPFGWQMPTNTDLVTDLPADFEVFGQAVATSMQDLLGGTTGQLLSKASGTDMDFTWTTPNPGDITGVTAGVGISGGGTSGDVTVTNSMATAITTNGDLIYGTGSGTFNRLGIGTTGQALTVAAGIPSWANASGADSVYNLRTAGNYVKQFGSQASSEIVVVEDVTWYVPIFLSAGSFDRIACRTSTGFSGSSTVRLGLYNASTTTGKPTTVVFDAGTVVASAISTNYEITITQTVSSGWYFLAFNDQTLTGTSAFASVVTSSSPLPSILFQGSTVQATSSLNFYSQTGVTGAFATAGTLVAPTNQAPLVALRTA